MKNKKTLSIEDLSPIERASFISICEYVKENSGQVTLKGIEEIFRLTNSKTEKLINGGIQWGFLFLEIKGGLFYRGKYCVIKSVSLTESGEDFLEDNQ